MLQINK